MDADMRDGCVFMAHLMQVVGPREIQVIGVPRAPLVVYSDASFDPDYWLVDEDRREQPRLGWVRFNHNLGVVPIGRSVELPYAALELVLPRQQHSAHARRWPPRKQWRQTLMRFVIGMLHGLWTTRQHGRALFGVRAARRM